MRRLLVIVCAAALALGACGEDDPAAVAPVDDGVVERDKPLSAELEAFLARVDTTTAFEATYEVLQRAGGTTAQVKVQRDALGGGEVTSGMLRVRLPASTEEEARLSELGIFSTFFADGPVAQITATAQRADADDPIFETRTLDDLGLELDCVRVPVQGATASQWCLTDAGVFGFVTTPSVQYQLTAYAVG